MYVCVCVCVYVCISLSLSLHIHIYMHMYIYVEWHIYIYIHITHNTYVDTCIADAPPLAQRGIRYIYLASDKATKVVRRRARRSAFGRQNSLKPCDAPPSRLMKEDLKDTSFSSSWSSRTGI